MGGIFVPGDFFRGIFVVGFFPGEFYPVTVPAGSVAEEKLLI